MPPLDPSDTIAAVSSPPGPGFRGVVRLSGPRALAVVLDGFVVGAATWEARAVLRLAEGDRSQAAELLREAEALFTQSSRPMDAARCHAAALAATRQAVAVSS